MAPSYIAFTHSDGEEDIIFGEYDDESSFWPNGNNSGCIGTYPAQFYKMYSRYAWVSNNVVTSDIRLKENIRSINSPLEKIMNIRGVQYDFISPSNPKWNEEKKNEIEYMDKDRIGFIAQELIEVYPELVKYDKKNDVYGVVYFGMIPILVEAIKEQQTMIDTLKAEIKKLSPEVSNLKSEITSTTEILGVENFLSQNKPNPFNQETEIEFYIASRIINAALYVYDMQGTQIKSYDIQQRGASSLTIHGTEFNPGMYLYTLIVDGNEVDTKRMILTD